MTIDPRSELDTTQVESLKAQLLASRQALLARGRRPGSAGDPLERGDAAGDAADLAEDSYEQGLTAELTDVDAHRLHEINDALTRIEEGSYGVCEGSGVAIGFDRLQAQPWTRYSADYQAKIERDRGGPRATRTV